METGDNQNPGNFLKDTSLNENKVKECYAVVSFSTDHLSLGIFHQSKKSIIALGGYDLKKSENSREIPEIIFSALESSAINLEDCISLQWIWSGSGASLIPQELYSENDKKKLLELGGYGSESELELTDYWPEHKTVSIYSIPQNLHSALKERFPHSNINHSSTALKNLSNFYAGKESFAFLMVGKGNAEFFIMKDSRLQFYNNFNFGVEEDLLYYVLFALEHSKLLAPEIDIKVGGKIHEKQRLWLLLEDYVGSVSKIELPGEFHLSEALNKQTVYRYINLLGGL